MSGFGLWQFRQGRRRSRLFIAVISSVLLLAGSLACGDPDSDSTVVVVGPETAAPDDAPPSSSSAPTTRVAPLLTVTKPPGVALGALPSLADLVNSVKPAVASIAVESVARGLFFDFTDEGAGSGIVVRPDGHVVTNLHVIQDADVIMVTLPSGDTYDAKVVGGDRLSDLAVLKIDAVGLPTADFGDSDALKVGDWVVALGNALNLKGGPTVTLGIVSARGRTVHTERPEDLYDMIQTDTAMNDGMSGGPLVNLRGEVIGINTAILRQAQGIGFTVSSSTALPIINSLIEFGHVTRPLIGLSGQDVTPALAGRHNLTVTEGIIVTRMSRQGPAFKGGIRPGDVISKIDGLPTPDMAKFLTLLWTYEVGEEVQVEYVSDGETLVTTVELAERRSQ